MFRTTSLYLLVIKVHNSVELTLHGCPVVIRQNMKTFCQFFLPLTLLVASASADEAPVKLEPVQVEEAPFGSLGISARARSTFWSIVNKDAKIKNMTVTEVASGSVADEKGLRAGDEVVKIDGTSIKDWSVRDITELWYQKEVGTLISFEITRGEAKEPKMFDLPIVKKPEKRATKVGEDINN